MQKIDSAFTKNTKKSPYWGLLCIQSSSNRNVKSIQNWKGQLLVSNWTATKQAYISQADNEGKHAK